MIIGVKTQAILDSLPTPQESWDKIEAFRKKHGYLPGSEEDMAEQAREITADILRDSTEGGKTNA